MTDPWVAALLRGRWVESLLAVTAVVAVTWPLGELVSGRPWTLPLVGVLLLVVAVGSAVRMARAPRTLVVLAQVLALVSALSWWGQAQRPEEESALVALTTLVRGGIHTIQTYAVPAPATPGLTLIVLAGIALLALLVEAVGVTFRAAAVAGIPLLLVSAGTASGTGQPLDPRYFLIASAAWLVLLAQQGRSGLEDWSAAGAAAATTADQSAARSSYRRIGPTARVMGLTGLLLAVLVPGMLPHLPPTVLLDGRSGEGAPGSVSFTDTLDLAQDLGNRSNAPVIRYRTDDASPPPLRVTASTEYVDGSWLPLGAATSYPYLVPQTIPDRSWSRELLTAHGLEPTTATLTVTQNGLRAPQLALPHPTSDVDLGDISWQWDPLNDTMVVDAAPRTYEAAYTEVAPLTTLPEEIGAPPVPLSTRSPVATTEQFDDGTVLRFDAEGRMLEAVLPDGRRDRYLTDGTVEVTDENGTVRRLVGNDVLDPLSVDPVSEERVRALAAELAGERTNQIDIAMELQRYFRGPEFSYSLTLADPVEGPDGEPLDPISHFLETRQGYCTQFATAMVMLARAQDIPARLAIGFLPGSQGLDGTHTVVAADAHAWPELFISGLGWTRFEPTPGSRSGAAPFFATPNEAEDVPTGAPDPTVGEPTPEPTIVDLGTGTGGGQQLGWFDRNAETLGRAALALAGIAALLSVVPLAGQWGRWRRRRGSDAAARIEGEWRVLLTSLADLGVPGPPAATPRGLQAHYVRELAPDVTTLDALARATDRLESARYSAHTPPVSTMREDVRRVVEWCRGRTSRRRRLRAALLPASGLAQLRSLLPGARRRARVAGAEGY
ncbi:DUF3488 and transglutaminase-like domain-containing protein [Georgenia sp. H159]|uniref:transglutaminase TgpA family protein n=1 Tax=Georgenia sp. H159 TaxID=3076115 RepID=UPI002D77F63D|nr:DUF3488 and transglutaminase-like domain-containing protein [Georgenia sp. H159]